MIRVTKCLGAVTLVLAIILSAPPGFSHDGEPDGGDLGGAVSFSDSVPALGISYEFTAHLRRKEKVGFVWYVGAKSWSEPSNPDGLKGWTHTSNWVALDLQEPAKLKVTVERQQGVVYTGATSVEVSRAELVPAMSLYAGWDETSDPEPHTFNNAGNFWSTIQFLANQPNAKGKGKIVFKTKQLPAGKYSLVIGGNPLPLASLASYPVAGCDSSVRLCYVYTGNHGYRALIEAK